MSNEPVEAAPAIATRRLVPPRVVLGWVVLAISAALAAYAVAPWVLPARVREGPLVQQVTPDGFTLVWYLTRPADCRVELAGGGKALTLDAVADDKRGSVRFTGLESGVTYEYTIRVGERALTKALRVRTAPTDTPRCAFIVFGDSGRGTRIQYMLALEMARVQPPADFLLHTGDVVYPDGARHRYEERFFAPYADLISRVAFWPSLGNHDVDAADAAPAYTEIFDLPHNGPPGAPPEHDYWFDYGPVRVAVFDSNVAAETLRDRVAPWLRTVFTPDAPPWHLVVCHHPPYTGGKYKPNAAIQEHLVPVFEELGVDVVFNGHDHNYQRIGPLRGGEAVPPGEGVLYIVTGAGGANLYEMKARDIGYVQFADDKEHSFTHVQIDGDKLTLRQLDADGKVLDEYTFTRKHSE